MSNIIKSVKKRFKRTRDPSRPTPAFMDDTQRQSSGSDRPVTAIGDGGDREGLLKEDQIIVGLQPHGGEIHEETHTTQGEVNPEEPTNASISLQPSGPGHSISPQPNIDTHAGSFFQGAHDITMNQPVMMLNVVSNEREISALERLAKKANADAALDSLARFPPPRCHEATRQSLLGQATKWLADLDRESPLLWLFGPAGSGKSAIAQTISEYCQERGWLGSTFFFSRPNKRDDPNRVIPSLVHQLAIANPTYRQAVTQLLTLDPTILEKARHVQFDQLIAKPAVNFKIQSSDRQSHPILMLLDGLDECNTDSAQREFIRLIAAFSGTCKRLRLPFVWIIASRPEWQIISEIDELSTSVNIWREQLHIDTPEAHEDVSAFLRDEFARIHRKYRYSFTVGAQWPTDAQFLIITSSANGLMLFADIVIKFADDDNFSNPAAQLQICVEFLKGNLTPEDGNPFDPLDALYRGILSTIDRRILPVTRQVLSIPVFVDNEFEDIAAQAIASFFHLDQATFYSALRRLHAVLRIPAPSDAQDEPLSFYHASFKDFLKLEFQSGGFGLSQPEMVLSIVRNHLRWHIECKLEETDGKAISEMAPWISRKSFDELARFVEKPIWELWGAVADYDISQLCDVLCEYHFCDAPFEGQPYGNFGTRATTRLLCALATYSISSGCPDRHRILRAQPVDPVDDQLLEKYAFLINARTNWAKLDTYFMETIQNNHWHFTFVSKQDPYDNDSTLDFCRDHLWDNNSTYFFLGHGTKTVLVFASREQVELETYLNEAFESTVKLHSLGGVGYPCAPERVCGLIRRHMITDSGSHPNTDVSQPFVHAFSLATHIVAFINDHPYHDYATRLNIMMDILSQCEPGDQDHILQCLCKQIIPDNLISISEHILVLLACFSYCQELTPLYLTAISAENIGTILSVDCASLRLALRVLSPFIIKCHLPIPNSTKPVEFVSLSLPRENQTFSSFDLLDQAGRLFFDIDGQIWLDISAQLVYYSNTFLNDTCTLSSSMADSMDCKVEHSSPSILQDCSSKLSNDIICATWTALHIAALKMPSDAVTAFWKLRCCHLDQCMMSWAATGHSFLGFVNIIYELDEIDGLGPPVRTHAKFDTDKQLLEKWAAMKVDYELAEFPIENIWHAVVLPLSLHYDFDDSAISDNTVSCKVFLLGHGDNSCLIACVEDL
ncbi:hypothetical protein D9756_001188 [Leucocoprinus leucothites]|uniref:Nephrocystin 3-like N-terminal domain-containing protein n=1 Tax=Leucocoprinus leucothites TaxID=201217 RepID=A0A8H5G4Z5_9AGAR|nr:hypothetical protein D9756_001188 [Leucoagaricus leucothites]